MAMDIKKRRVKTVVLQRRQQFSTVRQHCKNSSICIWILFILRNSRYNRYNMFSGLSLKDKMFFARHMAIMSRSGMQLLDILKTLKKQTRSRSFKKLLDELTEHIKNGQFLSDGLAKHQRMFGDFFVNIVRVGEISGSLADNLEYLAESLAKKKELESKVKGALIYPVIIFIATMGLTGGMMFFIFPKILPIFQSLKVTLPLITRIFIAVSTFVLQNGILLVGGFVAVVIGSWLLLRIRPIRYVWHRVLLMIPAVGSMVQNYNMVTFIRALSLLMKSGVKIVQALEITSNSLTNLVYKAALKEIAASVGQGDPISKHLAEHPHLFPGVFAQMIAVGEETGKLTDTGNYLADYYEGELDNATKTLSSVLEPFMLVVMGFIVGFVALAIILPIYEVTQHV